MLEAKKYLPIGSVVLLKNGLKKAMIIGIMQTRIDKEQNISEYDYMGVVYPEGFMIVENMFMFNHDMIMDVVYRGYENPEREAFIEKLGENMKRFSKK